MGKYKYKEEIKEAIIQELRDERSKLDKKNNVRTFSEIYKTQEHKKRSTPKKRICLKKVSFSLDKSLTEIFTNVTFRHSFKKRVTSLCVAYGIKSYLLAINKNY